MKNLFSYLITNCLSLWIIDSLFSSVSIDSLQSMILIALVLGVLNVTIKPILKVLAFPVTFLTFGLFSLIINALVLYLAFSFVPNASISSFGMTIVVSVVLSLVDNVINSIMGTDK